MPDKFQGMNICGLKLIIEKSTPVCTICACTEKLPWHQRLGHPCDKHPCCAHKHVTGIPKFDRQTTALDNQCHTCIQAKQTKVPAGPHLTQVATQPHQRLSIDFCFTVVSSSNFARWKECEGINGETCWMIATNHFTGMGTLASPRDLCHSGCRTFSAIVIHPAQTSVCIWTKAENFSTILKCRISSPRRGTPSIPQAQKLSPERSC